MDKIKLHVGCGKRHIPGWIHVDQLDDPHIDYQTSVDSLSMIQNESCSVVYASHVLEYFNWKEAEENVLPEWHRVLAPGGTLRLAVPNFEAISRLYQAGMPLQWFIGPMFGRMDVNGGMIYHRTTYDEQTLTLILERAGFTDMKLYDWKKTEHANVDDASKGYIPHMRDEGILLSLNMEATKL